MKMLKKKQIIIYVIAIMIMTAGYLNFSSTTNKEAIETSMQLEAKDDMTLADIGDATLVNSNDVITNEEESETNNVTSNEVEELKEKDTAEATSNSIRDNYFAQSKLERDTMYSQMLETYEKILNSTNSPETQKQIATEEIRKINETKNSIMICENLIKTKGFENVIIFVNGKSISVIIEREELESGEVAKIQNIIAREMNAEIDNIHISNK